MSIRLSVLPLVFVLCGANAYAQSWQPPADAQRCPSKWGATDHSAVREIT